MKTIRAIVVFWGLVMIGGTIVGAPREGTFYYTFGLLFVEWLVITAAVLMAFYFTRATRPK